MGKKNNEKNKSTNDMSDDNVKKTDDAIDTKNLKPVAPKISGAM